MSKMFKENGMLSEEGERVFKEMFDAKLNTILNQAENETELRIIGSLVQARVGDAIFNKLQAKREVTSKLASMSNEQFEGYLKAKYGPRWVLCSLTPEEFERCPGLTQEEVRATIEEGRKARAAAEAATPMVRIDRNRRYR